MGRYYWGDIEGKFWFGVQSSDDADFFGVKGCEPQEISYFFEKEDLPKIKKGVSLCEKFLGSLKKELDQFFSKNDSYNDDMIIEFFSDKGLNISHDRIKDLLKYYARLQLGNKILTCVEENGECSFVAEC